MLPIITRNFQNKMKAINETSFKEQKEKVSGLETLTLLRFSNEETFRGKNVELKAVECPIYDGPNPDFDEEIAQVIRDAEKIAMKEFFKKNGYDYDNLQFSQERIDLVDRFHVVYGHYRMKNWIYADYNEAKEWAINEPTEFLETIKSE